MRKTEKWKKFGDGERLVVGRYAYAVIVRPEVPVGDPEPFALGIAIEGKPGYYPAARGTYASWDAARVVAAELNAGLGLSAEAVVRIVASSMGAKS